MLHNVYAQQCKRFLTYLFFYVLILNVVGYIVYPGRYNFTPFFAALTVDLARYGVAASPLHAASDSPSLLRDEDSEGKAGSGRAEGETSGKPVLVCIIC